MANRNYPAKFIYGMHLMPVRLDATISIGASGAPTITNGLGIKSITRLVAGVYQIQLQDNYAQFLDLDVNFASPVSGSAVPGGSFSVGTVYQIVTLGSTTQAQWVAAGVPSGITAAPGVVFKAATVGAGTGTVKVLGNSGIGTFEIIGSGMLSYQPFNAGTGGLITFQCLAPTSSSVTTSIPTDPASGSTMFLELFLNNSNVQ